MKYNYKDLLEGRPCCESCDNWVKVDFGSGMYCPEQEQMVRESGYCIAYDGFWRIVHDTQQQRMDKGR